MKRTTILIFCMCIYSLSGFGQIIVNHLHTDITTLTENEINEAKSLLHIAYGHTSHGSQLTTGMTSLVAFANGGGKGMDFPDDIFVWNNGGINGALDLHDYAMGGDVGYYPSWVNNTTSYLGPVNTETGMGTTNPDVNVIIWSWCGQAAGYSEQEMIDKYLTPMSVLEETYYNVKFVYMTCHLNGTGETGNLNLRNEQIRNYCHANNKILYDFADIESYDPDGLVNYMPLNANDNCDYDSDDNGSRDKNWATDWQNTHTQDVDWYSCSCAHSQPLNGNLKAYAAWNLFSEIAKKIKRESIPNNNMVADTIISNEMFACFNALDTIFVAGINPVTIESGASATFIAGQSIRFLPGFHAHAGSTVNAWITSDETFCDALPAPLIAAVHTVNKSAELEKPVAEENVFAQQSIVVYPNPNNGCFTIKLQNIENETSIIMYSSIGQLLYNAKAAEHLHLVELPGVQRGIYFIKVINQHNHFDRKIIIR